MLDWVVRPRRETDAARVASRSFRYTARQIAEDLSGISGGLVLLSGGCRADVVVETALMLAASLAGETNLRVLLIDSSFRSGGLSQRLGSAGSPGLAQLIDDRTAEVAPLIRALAVPGVFFLPLGNQAAMQINRADVLDLLKRLRSMYDIVLLAQGPIDSDTRNLVFAAEADLVLIVAEEAASRLGQLNEAEAVFRTHGIANVKLLLSQPAEKQATRTG